MDYQRGLALIRKCIQRKSPKTIAEFATLEERFHENQRDERLFGSSENTRNTRAQIVYALNELALKYCGILFNDLCNGKDLPDQPEGPELFQHGEEKNGSGGVVSGITSGEEKYIGAGKRWAVIVGVNEYEDLMHYGRLQVCAKDAEVIYDKLLSSGFEQQRVRLLTDHTEESPTRENIITALKATVAATDLEDIVLFYYSGHGAEESGDAYLVARNGHHLALEDTAVKISRIKQIIEQAPARAKVIILDACHSGANIQGKGPTTMTEQFIRRVFEQAEGLAILASCKQGQVSYEWRANERSVFTYFLMEALEGEADLDQKGFVTVQDAHRHVSDGVKLWASRQNCIQTPTLQAELAGDIILAYIL